MALLWLTTAELAPGFAVESNNRLLPIKVMVAENPGYANTRGMRAFPQEHDERRIAGLLPNPQRGTAWSQCPAPTLSLRSDQFRK